MMVRRDMLQSLLEPYTLGNLPLRNRVVVGALSSTGENDVISQDRE
jgi:2,4-dienoyl-CoA reductase-like NADH-dependent reductase (Old Yellow Enzyme family)